MRRLALIALLAACTGVSACAAPRRIDLTHAWRFLRDPAARGIVQHWEKPGVDDRAWHTVEAAKAWTEQGHQGGRGYGWYRKWVSIPRAWAGRRVWLVLGGINDCGTVYCNGRKVDQFGDHDRIGVAEASIVAELTPMLRCGERNLIAVCAYDWASAGGLWRAPCLLTTSPGDLRMSRVLHVYPQYGARRLLLDVDTRGFGFAQGPRTVRFDVRRWNAKRSLGVAITRVDARQQLATASLAMADAVPGARYTVEATLIGARSIATTAVSETTTWPAARKAREAPGMRTLNNFVTVVLEGRVDVGASERAFTNPRDGWMMIRSRGTGAAPTVQLDGSADPLVWRTYAKTGAQEAMVRLAAGRHTLHVTAGDPVNLDVRTVPEIAYCYYPTVPLIPAYGAYDRAFCEKFVFPHVNTLVTAGYDNDAEMAGWVREGRQWIANAGLPGLNGPVPLADDVYRTWASNPGFSAPHYGGLIVDEFMGSSDAHYRAWTEAVRRLRENPATAGRRFYAWCGDLYDTAVGTAFCKQLMAFGYPMAWERYLAELPTAEEAERQIYRDIVGPIRKYRAAVPGVERHMVLTLGYLCAPPESQNRNPSVDYHVFTDMQIRTLATEPEFDGLYGIMEYSTRYADEESLRYAHELIRHYCIEGATKPMTADPYRLPHLKNPDFETGLSGWKVEPAEAGSIGTGTMEGYSWLQGRYQRTDLGNQYCRLTRSAAGPNTVWQQATGLTPGRLYAVKLLSGDMDALHTKTVLPVTLSVQDAETLPEYGFQQPFSSSYDHEVGPYVKDRPAYMNYHRLVFRATGTTARVVITGAPAGADGSGTRHAIAVNFVELQPFHAP